MVKANIQSPHSGVIDLEPSEADVLSFIAAHSNMPRPELRKVLSTSTKRARAIGAAILGEAKRPKPAYKFMAKRFTDASAYNLKKARVLRRSLADAYSDHAASTTSQSD